jgi:hypothetical protein
LPIEGDEKLFVLERCIQVIMKNYLFAFENLMILLHIYEMIVPQSSKTCSSDKTGSLKQKPCKLNELLKEETEVEENKRRE